MGKSCVFFMWRRRVADFLCILRYVRLSVRSSARFAHLFLFSVHFSPRLSRLEYRDFGIVRLDVFRLCISSSSICSVVMVMRQRRNEPPSSARPWLSRELYV